MSAPDSSTTGSPGSPSLYVQAQAGKAVIRKVDDQDEREQRFFDTVAQPPGSGVVLASAAAVTDPSFLGSLHEAFRGVLGGVNRGPQPPQVWVAVSGLHQAGPQGWSPAQRLADEFRVDVLAPDGPLALVPGGAIFAGTGEHAWRLFRTGTVAQPFALRLPTPRWESALPRAANSVSGLLAEPVPAGLLLRPAESPRAPDAGVVVPQSAQRPRVLLAPSVTPAQVAAAVGPLPPAVRGSMELIPTSADTAAAEWMQQLARLLGHDVFAATGTVRRGEDGVERAVARAADGAQWQPFPLLLRYSASGAQVVSAAAAPRGWVPAGPALYRWGGMAQASPGRPVPGELQAKVVPSGLALVEGMQAGAPDPADRLAFEPDRMTLTLGRPHVGLPQQVPQVLHALLGGLSPQQRGRLRLLVLGLTDEPLRAQLRTAAGELAQRLEFPTLSAAGGAVAAAPPGAAPAENAPQQPPSDGGTTTPDASTPAADAAAPEPITAPPLPATRPRTESQGPAPNLLRPRPVDQETVRAPVLAPPDQPAPDAPEQPANATTMRMPVVPSTSPQDEGSAPPEPAATQDTVMLRIDGDQVRDVTPEASAEQPPAPVLRLVPAPLPDDPLPADHQSTAEERTRFSQWAGEAFDDSLPSVNTALATFPALRESAGEPDSKADFVAVHLYIGGGPSGGNAINRALRGPDAAAVRDYAACLTSGLRRLPVHRGASFRTARVRDGHSPLPGYEPGTLLDEPAFLSGTSASDVTVEDPHVDVVIWSLSARRVAAIGQGAPDEVVFSAATRFKVLAVDRQDTEQDGSGSAAPPAVLLRELRPGEAPAPGELTEADEAVLPRLRRALHRRHANPLRVLTDADHVERFGEPVGLVLGEVRGAPAASRAPTGAGADPVAPQPVSAAAH
ncbi:hypothetical protein GCM10027271_39380 [Saccharopolyspora gloriosae]|uniref:NAD(+)--protein-arginine ADP-ribosyltransferase n=1 Tax=Saccharopolyspora gloriosae TaxID=455344 RepID=A0A840NJ29_9PSEU|nr:hypothetical protein [Saccharopolyspora gloriosae]MBB5069172.1 hypothetical protein [Saccharopolyspora gloriosae]